MKSQLIQKQSNNKLKNKTFRKHAGKDIQSQGSKTGKLSPAGIRGALSSPRGKMHLLSFLMPVIAMVLVFAGNRIWPFGDRCFLRTDLYHQYAPFHAELLRKLHNGGSLYYTWNIGAGTNFLALIGYYLSSFFNLFLIFVPEKLVIDYISYLVIFKMGLAGLTFSFLLYRRRPRYLHLIPLVSLFYAMSGYLAAYSWNLMWMDCIWLTPLILLGIERLVFDKKPLLYSISLGLAILSNYYIGIMLCIFSVLYYLVQIPDLIARVEDYSGKVKVFFTTSITYAWASLLSGALSAVILIPEIRMFKLTASSDISFPTSWQQYNSIMETLGRHLINVEIENGLDHWPNIYCGVAIMICLPLFYLNKQISLPSKITRTLLAVFMLFSFSTNVMSFIWHGFHYPNSLPARQSFLYIALLLTMSYEGLQGIKRLNRKYLGFITAMIALFIVLMDKLAEDDAFGMSCYWLSLAFILVYSSLLLLYRSRLYFKPLTLVLLATLVCFSEATINMAVTSVTTVSKSEYLNYTEPYKKLITSVMDTDPDLYRFEKLARKTKNDGAFVGYPSISTFSSVSYGGVSDFYGDLGMESSMNAYCNKGITPLMDSLLGVKYILTTTAQDQSALMTLLDQNESCYVYENLYTMPVGYMLPATMDEDLDTQWDPIEIQNDFSHYCQGQQLFYQIYDTDENGDTMTIHPEVSGHVFVQLDSSTIDQVTAQINGETTTFENTDRLYLLDLGYLNPEDEITLTASEDEEMLGTAYYLDEDNFIELVDILKEQAMQVSDWSDTSVRGTIDVKEDGLFFLSIPYDTGWTLKVDGQEKPMTAFKDSYLSCDLTAGSHEISLTYRPDGFLPGLLLTLSALVILGGIAFCRYRKRQEQDWVKGN